MGVNKLQWDKCDRVWHSTETLDQGSSKGNRGETNRRERWRREWRIEHLEKVSKHTLSPISWTTLVSLIVLTCHRNRNENRESGKTDNDLARRKSKFMGNEGFSQEHHCSTEMSKPIPVPYCQTEKKCFKVVGSFQLGLPSKVPQIPWKVIANGARDLGVHFSSFRHALEAI